MHEGGWDTGLNERFRWRYHEWCLEPEYVELCSRCTVPRNTTLVRFEGGVEIDQDFFSVHLPQRGHHMLVSGLDHVGRAVAWERARDGKELSDQALIRLLTDRGVYHPSRMYMRWRQLKASDASVWSDIAGSFNGDVSAWFATFHCMAEESEADMVGHVALLYPAMDLVERGYYDLWGVREEERRHRMSLGVSRGTARVVRGAAQYYYQHLMSLLKWRLAFYPGYERIGRLSLEPECKRPLFDLDACLRERKKRPMCVSEFQVATAEASGRYVELGKMLYKTDLPEWVDEVWGRSPRTYVQTFASVAATTESRSRCVPTTSETHPLVSGSTRAGVSDTC